jgi:exonuclease III
VKIVSLNIRHGGGTRTARILSWLMAQAADAILLVEWRSNASGGTLKVALEKAGYLAHGETRSPTANGMLVAAKKPLSTFRITPPHAVSGEMVATDLGGFRMLCGYFPQLDAKKSFFDLLLEQAAAVQTPLLVIGDLNTGRNDIDLEFGATKFSCADQFAELTQQAGMADLWRRTNGADAREWTWRSHKNGFRIDHAFGNRALISSFLTIRCWYDHSPREDGLTDHSGLIVDLIN